MKKITLLFIFITSICNAQFWKKKPKEDDYQPKKENIQEIKKMFKPTDSIGAIRLRDQLVDGLQGKYEYDTCLINKKNDLISEVAYLYKNKVGEQITIGFNKTEQYVLETIISPFKNLYPLWSQNFYPGIPEEKIQKEYKFKILQLTGDNVTASFKQKNKFWELKNLN